MTCCSRIDILTAPFAPISLGQLNAKAEMMARIDNKYVMPRATFLDLIPNLAQAYDVLEIDGKRAFAYDTRYFDDADYSAYFEHHQGKRLGFKVRARSYVDAGLCFLEVKVKGQRGMTEKYRMPYDPANLHGLSDEAAEFARTTYGRQYGKPFPYALAPSLDVSYRRITLVAKTGGERITVDTDLRFQHGGKVLDAGADRFIIETKSSNGRGYADRLLRMAGQRPTRRCSKYCIGMALTGRVTRYNRFIPTMRKLGLHPPAWVQLQRPFGMDEPAVGVIGVA